MNPLDPTVNVATLQCVLTPLDPSHADVLLDQLETLSRSVSIPHRSQILVMNYSVVNTQSVKLMLRQACLLVYVIPDTLASLVNNLDVSTLTSVDPQRRLVEFMPHAETRQDPMSVPALTYSEEIPTPNANVKVSLSIMCHYVVMF